MHALLRAMDAPHARQRQDPARLLSLLECEELLPGWYDDWVLYERERLEQRKIRALETMATTAYERGEWVTALDAAREAARREPLLDAMRSIVIRSRLGLGDVPGAVQEYRLYRRFLARELGIEPPQELTSLLDGAARHHTPAVDGGLVPAPRRSRRSVRTQRPDPAESRAREVAPAFRGRGPRSRADRRGPVRSGPGRGEGPPAVQTDRRRPRLWPAPLCEDFHKLT